MFIFISQHKKCISVPGVGICKHVWVVWWAMEPAGPGGGSQGRGGWIPAMVPGAQRGWGPSPPLGVSSAHLKLQQETESSAAPGCLMNRSCPLATEEAFVCPGGLQSRSSDAACPAAPAMSQRPPPLSLSF